MAITSPASHSSTPYFEFNDPKPYSKESKRLERMEQSKKQLVELQNQLDKLIDSMTKNPSILSRAASFWGAIPLWQKIIGGLLLLTPPLLLGLLLQSLVCYVITGFMLAIYTSISAVLDEHFTHTQYHTKDLKTGVSCLAEGMTTVLAVLQQISEDLAEQVASFAKENEHFSQHLNDLETENALLSNEVEGLKHTENALHQTESELSAACFALKQDLEKQSLLATETQDTLNKLQLDFSQKQQELQEKTTLLDNTTRQFQEETTRYSKKIETLGETIRQLSTIHLEKTADQEAFKQKLAEFINNKELRFDSVFNQVDSTEKELVQVKERLQKTTEEYEKLLVSASAQISRLERIVSNPHRFHTPSNTDLTDEESKAPTPL